MSNDVLSFGDCKNVYRISVRRDSEGTMIVSSIDKVDGFTIKEKPVESMSGKIGLCRYSESDIKDERLLVKCTLTNDIDVINGDKVYMGFEKSLEEYITDIEESKLALVIC